MPTRMICEALLAILMLALPAAARGAEEAPRIGVTIENRSPGTLRCLLVFAHWTSMDLPLIAPGGRVAVELRRATDRALFVPRPGDGRPMMLEALHCGYDARWSDSLVKLDWTQPMLSDRRSFLLSCARGERPACRWEAALE